MWTFGKASATSAWFERRSVCSLTVNIPHLIKLLFHLTPSLGWRKTTKARGGFAGSDEALCSRRWRQSKVHSWALVWRRRTEGDACTCCQRLRCTLGTAAQRIWWTSPPESKEDVTNSVRVIRGKGRGKNTAGREQEHLRSSSGESGGNLKAVLWRLLWMFDWDYSGTHTWEWAASIVQQSSAASNEM